ncbi:CHASE2 domain-containing protein, partial [bacterium]|nr:CHASE2 domain-containing protein [bacterium]
MAEQAKSKSKLGTAKAAVIALCGALFVSILSGLGLLEKLEFFTSDLRYVTRPAIETDTSIYTIDIDDPSIEQIGRWPWTWDRHAAILDMLRLYGARQAAFVEPYFNEPGPITVQRDQARQIALSVTQMARGSGEVDYRQELSGLIPDYNDRFIDAVGKFPRTFIGTHFAIPEGAAVEDPKKIRAQAESNKRNFSRDKNEAHASLDTFSVAWRDPGSLLLATDIVPITAALSRNIAGAGFSRIVQDIDGKVRRTPLLVWYDGRAHPSIGLSMAAAYFGCALQDLKIEPGKYIEIPGKDRTVRVPIDEKGYMLVNWAGEYQKTFNHTLYNVIALHYMHRTAKAFIRQYRPDLDNPNEVFQKLGEFMMRQQMLPAEDVQWIATQIYYVWIMDFFMERGAAYDIFLRSTGLEDDPSFLFYWNQISVNRRVEEVMRSNQTPDYSAVLFSLSIPDTDIYRDGFDHTAFFYRNGRINEVRPLFFLEPSVIAISGGEIRFSPLDLHDKSVFVGLTATGLNAQNPTPYQRRYQMFGLIPNVYNTIATGQFLRAQAPWMRYVYILFYALAITWIVLHFRPLGGLAVVLLTSGLHFACAWAAFVGVGVIMPVVPPVLTVIVCYVAANLYRYVEEQRERQKVRGLFGAMVSPQVLKMMEDNPDKFALGGEKYEATMFSSDVSGFTTISEGVTAQELADILNIYLTPMSNIIMNFDGFVDKYEGDAIKADYGVPLADPNHAWKGCFAALLQQEDLSVVQRLLLLKYGVKITARMGVNTGIVAAGNKGSEKKRQYTVMGEAVTIAEELEPINKLYESWIAIGALTYEKSADYVDVRLLDRAAMG